tara:strand:+ start:916 stop:1245 length:330 start_codon:yes stop_codon:yes gene_type:complete
MLFFEVSATDMISFPAENVHMIDATGANAGVIMATPGGVSAGNTKSLKITFNSETGKLEECIKELSALIFAGNNPVYGGVIDVANTTDGTTHKSCPNLVLTNLAIAITQ